MKNRPLCSLCLVIVVLIGTLTAGAGAKFVRELRPSPVEQYGEKEDWLIVRGQVYKKEEKEKYQVLYLKNCSIYIQKYQQIQQNQEDRKGQKSFVQESRMLIYDEKKQKIQIGNEVEAEGNLSFFEPARNPGNFDQKAYYQRQNIHGKVWSEKLKVTDCTVKPVQNALVNVRMYWRNVLLSEAGEKNGSILSAILLGEKSQMDSETKKLYQVNGIGHILAISGLHLSVIGIGIYQLLRKLTGSFVAGGVGGIFFFLLYVLMIGFTVSVIRAGIMYLFRVGAEIVGRHYDSVTALAVAAATVLIWRPLSIYDGAFWLSFLAVFAVVIVMPAGQMEKEKYGTDAIGVRKGEWEHQRKEKDQGEKKEQRTEKGVWNNREDKKWKVKSMIKSNIEMQLFLLPVVLYFFYEFPLYATFLNLLVIPLMTVLLSMGIAGSLICMLGSGVFRIPGKYMLGICGWILTLYEKCCEWLLELPGARVVIGRPQIWQILFYYGCVAIVCAVQFYRKKHDEEQKREQKTDTIKKCGGTQKVGRVKKYSGIQRIEIGEYGGIRETDIVEKQKSNRRTGHKKTQNDVKIHGKQKIYGKLLTGTVCALGLFVLFHNFENSSQMQATVLDVGQGDGIFLKSPKGMNCMIDGGSSDVKNVGQYRIEPYLLSKGVGKLDYAFISHGDSDHTNGIEEMITRQKIGVKIKTLVFPEESVWDESLKKLAVLATKNGVQVAVMSQGQLIYEESQSILRRGKIRVSQSRENGKRDNITQGNTRNQGMEILCLGPGSDYSGESGNAASMVLAVSYRDFDFLFIGDVEGAGEEDLCEAIETYCPEKTFEILKAAHHGSRNSSSETFLHKVSPKYTIISAGVENSYGHPHRETIERLRKNGSRIWNTANCGGIEITVEFGGKIQYTLKEGSEMTAYEESE